MPPTTAPSQLLDPISAAAVDAAIAADTSGEWSPDPFEHRTHGYPIARRRAELLYVLAHATGATRIVEFATSIGVSTIHLAAAVRDNGGGIVVGSELIADKVAAARANLAAAGLDGYVDVREGDARHTLGDVGGPIDLFLLDGWPSDTSPSLDRQVLDLVLPQFRPGTLLADDNGQADVLDLLRDPSSGFRSVTLGDDRDALELAVYVG
ncbi:MAG: class I SAM-dependent methyltransferase [Ilumatobacteraceae bacterium]